MRLLIDTSGVQFRVCGAAKPRAGLQGQGPAGHDAGRRADLDRPPGRDRARPRDQGNHLGRGGWRAAQGDLRWLRRGPRPGVRTVGRAGRQDQARVPRRSGRPGRVREARAGGVTGPAMPRTIPTSRSGQETPMTSIHAYDPASAGTAPPELPPMPIGALAVGTAELLQQAADLPAPTSSRSTATRPSTSSSPGTRTASGPSPAGHAGSAASRPATPARSSPPPAPGTPRTSTTTASPCTPSPSSRPHRPASSRPGEP